MSKETIAARLERIRDMAVERLTQIEKTITEATADQPFDGVKIPYTEQVQNWLLGRNDPAYWAQLIEERRVHHGLTADLVPREVIQYDREMSSRLQQRLARHSGGETEHGPD